MNMDLLITYALSFIGTSYRWGGDDPMDGYDCSGFAQEILTAFGVYPPGDLSAQALHDWLLQSGSKMERTVGALAFYGKSDKEITHVAVVIDPELMIEAGGGGSKTLTKADAAKQNAFIRVRPVDKRKDLVAVVMPQYQYSQPQVKRLA